MLDLGWLPHVNHLLDPPKLWSDVDVAYAEKELAKYYLLDCVLYIVHHFAYNGNGNQPTIGHVFLCFFFKNYFLIERMKDNVIMLVSFPFLKIKNNTITLM